MSEIRIGPGVQVALLLAFVAGVLVAIGLQLPEIRRYLNIRSM